MTNVSCAKHHFKFASERILLPVSNPVSRSKKNAVNIVVAGESYLQLIFFMLFINKISP